jgi:hypothetical protein
MPDAAPAVVLRLRTQLESLDAILAGVADDALQRRPASGKWSALENLAHLARHHEVMLHRVRRLLAEDRPAFPRYRAEDDPDWPAWASRSAAEVRARLMGSRAELVAIVDGLAAEQLSRTAGPPAVGAMPLTLWLEFFLLHEAHHLYQAFARARGA